jgi:tRNA1Val (adenine37-N6)-methyltransferase
MQNQRKIKPMRPGSPFWNIPDIPGRRRRGYNTYFQFKQFIIHQDKTAMKVCTDACILGAWTADRFEKSPVQNTLDIGCGTGLLSLMIAQKIHTSIDAVEMNRDAFMQASENISISAWSEKINVIHTALQDFISATTYELIICNPPFYENDLKSPDESKNAAKHDTTMSLEDLIIFVKAYLSVEGSFILLLPYHRAAYLEEIANDHGLFVKEKLLIKQSPRHEYFRVVLFVSKKETGTAVTNELIIHDNERNYTADFEKLLKDYYLKL